MADQPDTTPPSIASLQERIKELERQIASHQKVTANWDALSDEAKGERLLSAHAALLEDANSWAQHYSTVRMTVTTFLTAVALGIVQFQWQEPTWAGVIGAAGCWIVALVLFVVFTRLEFRKLNETIHNKLIFRAVAGHRDAKGAPIKWGPDARPKKLSAWSDGPAWTLGLLTFLFCLVVIFEWNPLMKGKNADAECTHECNQADCDSR